MNIKTLWVLPFILFGVSLNAGTLPIISNFNGSTLADLGGFPSLNGSWSNSGEMTLSSGILTIGSASATGEGNLTFAAITSSPYAWTAGNQLSYTASVNAGNASTSFTVALLDAVGISVLTATINTSGWVAGTPVSSTALFTPTGLGGSTSTLTYFNLSGDSSANAFRMSFDQFSITAIPEPSTYVALFGAATLGLAAWRKRLKVA